MCFGLKDYDEIARLRVRHWRERNPTLKEPTLPQLARMISGIPSRKREGFGSLIHFYVEQS